MSIFQIRARLYHFPGCVRFSLFLSFILSPKQYKFHVTFLICLSSWPVEKCMHDWIWKYQHKISTKVEKGIFQKDGSSVFLFVCFFFYVRSIVPISVARFVGYSLSDIHFHFEPWKVVHVRIINHWVVNNTWPLAGPLCLCLFSVCKAAPGVSRRTWEELKRHQRILKNSTSSGEKRTQKNEIINLPYSLTSNCTDVL